MEDLIKNWIARLHSLEFLLQVVWGGSQEYAFLTSPGEANGLVPHMLRIIGHRLHPLLVSSINKCRM